MTDEIMTVESRNKLLKRMDSPFRCCARCSRDVIKCTQTSVFDMTKKICDPCALAEKIDKFNWVKENEVREK